MYISSEGNAYFKECLCKPRTMVHSIWWLVLSNIRNRLFVLCVVILILLCIWLVRIRCLLIDFEWTVWILIVSVNVNIQVHTRKRKYIITHTHTHAVSVDLPTITRKAPPNTIKTNWILHKHLNKHRNNEQMWNLCFYVYLFIINQKKS